MILIASILRKQVWDMNADTQGRNHASKVASIFFYVRNEKRNNLGTLSLRPWICHVGIALLSMAMNALI